MFQQYKKLWIALGALIILTPLGILAGGTAFGEWSIDQLPGQVGFIPRGMARMTELWKHAPLRDYAIPGFSDTFLHSALGYISSALVGVLLIVLVMAIFSKIIKE